MGREEVIMEFEGKTREELRETLDQLLGRVAELESSQLELQRTEQALMSRKRVSDRLLSTAQSLTESLDVREVLNRIACGAREILNCYGIAIYLLEDDDETLTPVVSIEPPIEEMVLAAPLKVKGSFTGQAIIARRALVFNDAASDPSGYYIPGTPVQEEERVIVAPFIDSDIVLGAMCLQRTGEMFGDEDLVLAETFAAYAATALKNARVHDELQREVEERKRGEAALRESEEKYRTLVEQSLQGLVIAVGPDDPRWSFVNPAMGEMLGYDVDELMALEPGELARLVHKEDWDMFLSRFRDRLAGKPAPPRYEVRFLGKDGSVRWLEISAIRITYEGRHAVQATFVDITDSKSMQQQLRTSAQEWRSTFDAISDYVFLLGLDGKVLRCNKAMRDHLGRPFDMIIGQPCYELIHEELEPIEHCPMSRMQSSHQRETLVIQKEKRWFHILSDPVLDDRGDLIAAVHILSDVTERIQADQEREELIEELQDALSKVKTLSGLLPMCARCKKIRDDQGYWNQLEEYIHKHADVEFTHGICPECGKELYGELWDRATSQGSSSEETKEE